MVFPLAAAAALGGAAASYFGQRETNSANAQMQEDANNSNIWLNREVRTWQENMANTAHQREVRDLRAAGLNPILSGTGGSGASSAGGGAVSVNAAKMENALGQGVSSALASANMSKDLEMAESQKALNASAIDTQKTQQDLNVSSASKTRQETIRTAVDNDIRGPTLDALKKAAQQQAQADLTKATIDNKMATYDAIQNRTKNTLDTIGTAKDLINPFKGLFGPGKNIPPVGEIFKNRKGQSGYYDKNGKFNKNE